MIKKKCEICGSDHRVCKYKKKIYLCNRHYKQMQNYGKILERTKFDKNEIIDCGEYFEMCLYNCKHKEVARTIFDKNQLNKIKQHKWRIRKGYVVTTNNLYLHQLILSKKKGFEIDHINHNPLDNRNENLRFVTVSQNQMNRKGVLGISWYKNDKRWIASIMVDNKRIYLGMFIKKEDALKVRKKAEKKYFGEFAFKKLTKN